MNETKDDPEIGWGVIRYAPGSGRTPEDDCAAFDGWHAARAGAAAVYRDWRERYPHWIVALVQAHEARFSDADWGRAITRPPNQRTLCPLKCSPSAYSPPGTGKEKTDA